MTKLEAGSIIGSSELNVARSFEAGNRRPRLRVRPFDDAWEPEKAKAALADIQAAGIRFVVTSHTSTCALAIEPEAAAAGMLVLVTGAVTDALSGKDDLTLRVVPDLRAEQEWLAREVAASGALGGGRRVLVLRDTENPAYTGPALSVFSRALRAAEPGVSLESVDFAVSTLDVEALRPVMAASRFDLLYLLVGGHKSSALALAQVALSLRPEARILLTPWMHNPEIVGTLGPAIGRTWMPSHFPPRGEDPAVDAFADRYASRFGTRPTRVSLQVRRALELLDAAFAAGARDPASVKAWLVAKGVHATSLGEVRFDATGDASASFWLLRDLEAEF